MKIWQLYQVNFYIIVQVLKDGNPQTYDLQTTNDLDLPLFDTYGYNIEQ